MDRSFGSHLQSQNSRSPRALSIREADFVRFTVAFFAVGVLGVVVLDDADRFICFKSMNSSFFEKYYYVFFFNFSLNSNFGFPILPLFFCVVATEKKKKKNRSVAACVRRTTKDTKPDAAETRKTGWLLLKGKVSVNDIESPACGGAVQLKSTSSPLANRNI